MKILAFATPEEPRRPRPGALVDGAVIDLQAARLWARPDLPEVDLPDSTLELIHAGEAAWSYARNLVKALEGEDPLQIEMDARRPLGHRPEEVIFYPPLARPVSLRDFYAFENHVSSANAIRSRSVPEEWYRFPVFYFGNPNTIFGHTESIPYPSYTRALDYELEIACIIGKPGVNITVEGAEDHIFGYTIFNDWSARDVQRLEMKVGLGPAKGKDFASSLGPWIVTPDELADRAAGRPGVYDLKMAARVNGEVRSQGNWKDLYYSFGEMMARASQDVPLLPGEVIGSGTVGTGCLLELTQGEGPWLRPGDVVELEIERLGILKNTVKNP